jgi:raffinose/stachyose/melibiose transport system substrate-binding protein
MTLKRLMLASAIALTGGTVLAQDVTLTIESWRTDDTAAWADVIIPAFEAANPGIKVVYSPTAPTEYNAALNAKLEGGTAGDLIVCRPFDLSLALYDQGHLAPLNDLPGMANYSAVAKSAWSTDDGSTTFCVPMASVIHGFMYNKDIFAELGLEEPKTRDEFFAVLDAIKANGTYVPLALGLADQWEAATMGWSSIGPNYWKGEEGRLGLIAGTAKLTDEPFVETFRELARWKDYMGDGYEAQTYSDTQNLFALGRAAIMPAGSWDITLINNTEGLNVGAFPPPVAAEGDTCYISDHTDIGIGMNAKTAHPEEAKKFLDFVASAEFGALLGNNLPGFFPLSSHPVSFEDPLVKEFVSWRDECEETIRASYAIIGRGTPNLDLETWNASVQVIKGAETPEDASARLQAGLDAWYKPGAM